MTLDQVFLLGCLDDDCKGTVRARFPGGCGYRFGQILPETCPICRRDTMRVIKRPPLLVPVPVIFGFDELPTS